MAGTSIDIWQKRHQVSPSGGKWAAAAALERRMATNFGSGSSLGTPRHAQFLAAPRGCLLAREASICAAFLNIIAHGTLKRPPDATARSVAASCLQGRSRGGSGASMTWLGGPTVRARPRASRRPKRKRRRDLGCASRGKFGLGLWEYPFSASQQEKASTGRLWVALGPRSGGSFLILNAGNRELTRRCSGRYRTTLRGL